MEDQITRLERRDGRPPREHSKETSDDGVDQEEEHRQMLRVSGAAGELNFPRPTGARDLHQARVLARIVGRKYRLTKTGM
jgi:hypothetical protein